MLISSKKNPIAKAAEKKCVSLSLSNQIGSQLTPSHQKAG